VRAGRGAAAATVTAALAATLALGGCGGDDGDDPSRTAGVVPSDVAAYADGAVKPSDDDREALESSLGTLLGDADVDATIASGLDGLFAGESISWAEDIEPWAGERGAIFVVDPDSDGAVVVEIDDEDAAVETFERLSEPGADDVADEYDLGDGDGDGDFGRAAIVEDYAVIGSEAAVAAAVEAADGDSLLDADEFDAAAGDLSDDRLVTLYVDPGAALDTLIASGEIDDADGEVVAGALQEPVGLALGAGSEQLRAEVSIAPGGEGPAVASSELIERVPDGAWIAVAAGDAGPALASALGAIGPLVGDLDELEATIGGIDLSELAAATGDAAAYFGGTSLLGIRGAVMLEALDAAAVAAFLERLADGLAASREVEVQPLAGEGEGFTLTPAGVPLQFPFVLRDDLLVAGLGTEAVEQAFEPDSSLADSDAFGDAAEALGDGDEPIAYVDFEQMLELLDGIPGLWGDPDLAAARPYLERLDDFVTGAAADDGRSRVTMALTLRGESGE